MSTPKLRLYDISNFIILCAELEENFLVSMIKTLDLMLYPTFMYTVLFYHTFNYKILQDLTLFMKLKIK